MLLGKQHPGIPLGGSTGPKVCRHQENVEPVTTVCKVTLSQQQTRGEQRLSRQKGSTLRSQPTSINVLLINIHRSHTAASASVCDCF